MNNGPNKQNYHHTLRADSQVFSMFKLKMHIKEVDGLSLIVSFKLSAICLYYCMLASMERLTLDIITTAGTAEKQQ